MGGRKPTGHRRRLAEVRRLAVLLPLLLATAAGAAPRVVAIGDVHGAIDVLDAILREAALQDADGRWVGGDAVLVQTGDFLDKGPRVRAVMDRLRDLQGQAPRSGGRVVVLLGNHEAMNLMREYRDVAPAAWAEFADARSEQRRRDAWGKLRRWTKRRRRELDEEVPEPDEAAWMASHPPGRLEYQAALGPHGAYGRWLRGLPGAVRIGGSVFLHGGIDPELGVESVEQIDETLTREIHGFEEACSWLEGSGVILPFFARHEVADAVAAEVRRVVADARRGFRRRSPSIERRHREILQRLLDMGDWWSLRPDGPLWFRGFALWSDAEGTPRVRTLLEGLRAERFVVGHSVLNPPGTIRGRFEGRVYLIDAGMLTSLYGGRAAALEIRDDSITALYVGSREVLWRRPAAARIRSAAPSGVAAGDP